MAQIANIAGYIREARLKRRIKYLSNIDISAIRQRSCTLLELQGQKERRPRPI